MAPTMVEQKPHISLPSVGTTFSPPFRPGALSNNQLQLDRQTQREKLLASLRGQTVRIPHLAPLFKHWPTKTNPEVDRMRIDIRDRLDR